MNVFEMISNLVQTRINNLVNENDPLNDENDQELIETIGQEILELEDFLNSFEYLVGNLSKQTSSGLTINKLFNSWIIIAH